MTNTGNKITRKITDFLRCESGATAIEYGLIAALISVSIIAGATLAGNSMSNNFNTIANAL